MDTTSPISPSLEGKSYVCVKVDTFTHYDVLHSSLTTDAAKALNVLFDRSLINFGIPDILVNDSGNKYFNGDLAHFCRIFNV